MKRNNKFWIFLFTIIGMILILTNACKKDDTVTEIKDADGNVYTTVIIGTQTWIVENLNTTKFRNGDPIPLVTGSAWYFTTTGAYCNLNDDANNATIYGHLYNWTAVMDSRNIAPEGFHVPSKDEWTTLIDFLGGSNVAGGKMKEIDTLHWQSPNTGATNESGFLGLPGHTQLTGWHPETFGQYGGWWSTTVSESDSNYAHNVSLSYQNSIAYRGQATIIAGKSIRCIKD